MAALRNMAVVILQQTATKMRDGAGAVLVPSISSTAWDAGIANRVVLFQDFGLEYGKESTRHAGVLKAAGIAGLSNGGMEKAVSFAIRDVCSPYQNGKIRVNRLLEKALTFTIVESYTHNITQVDCTN